MTFMPQLPRPFAAPLFALALILAISPLTLVAPTPAAASIITPYTSASREPVAPGVELDQGQIVTSDGSQAVNLVEIDLDNPAISFESALSNGRVTGLERTTSQAQNHSFEGHRVAAAINGDTWIGFSNDMEDAPSGLHVESGELVVAGSTARPTFGITADGQPLLGSVLVGISLGTGLGQFVINEVNQPRASSEVVVYTPHFASSTSTAASGIDLVISGLALPLRTSGTWTGVVSSVRPAEGGWPIAPGTVVVTVPPTSQLGSLTIGEPVTLTTTITTGWESIRQVVGGREWIVRDGAISISPRPPSADLIHPRSALGLTSDQRMILATVDGRQAGWSDGVTLPDLAEMMIERGAVSAINLDGGGSTTLAIHRAGTPGLAVVNRPSDGSERPVTNSILVIDNSASASATGLDFDGTNDHVTLGPASGLNSNNFTVETWFRRDGAGVMAATTSGTGGVSAAPLMAKGRSGGGTINWFMGVTADSHLAADFESASDDSNHAVIGSTTLSNGSWYHAAATYDGTTFRLYLNGALEGSASVANGPGMASNHPPSLATAMTPTGVATGFFDGVLDEARVWNVARSAADIAAARTLELTSGTGLIARYGMNEGTGIAVANSVAGGPAGTTVGGPAWVPGAPFGAGGPADPPPDAPTGVTATPGNNSISLTWTANTEPDLAGYNVYRDGAPAGPSVQAVGAGDIASCSSTGDEATAALLATIPGDVLALGDTVYEDGTLAEYTNCYQPNWGQHKARTRPVVGNHEYGTADASGYFAYFGAAAGTQGQGYYSYDYGTWHVIVLNSMCANVGGCGAGSPQLVWLEADLAANDAQCTMALWHHPRFSSAQHGSDPITQPLYQALYDANADLILTGHDHDYERFAPQTATGALDVNRGIRQFVVGTGGRNHRGLVALQPNSEVRNFDTFGVIRLQLKPTSFEWEFVPEAGKTFSDTGSDECHDANGPIATNAPLNGSTPLTSPSFTDTTAVNGTTYNYTVTAVDDTGQESAPSATVSATPAPGPPRTALTPVSVSADTGDKPQSKLWFHGGSWWAVLPSTATSPPGTWLWKLGANGTWANSLHLSSRTDTHADSKRVQDVTHILLYGPSPELVSIEFDAASGSYRPWSARPDPTPISLPNSETATIEVDTSGRMWLASENGSSLIVSYADAPYSSFAVPITLDGNIGDDDIGVVTRLAGNRIGVLWSNQNTRRFGFKVHADGAAPASWSADEAPASQSANDSLGLGMADDHLNVALASDGTLYAAVKTGWDTVGFARIALLVRRPSGTWDPLHPVDDTGTRPVVLLDDLDGTLRVVYTSIEGLSDIVMKTTSTTSIAFGSRETIMSGGLNNATKAKENWTDEGIVLASSASMAQGVRLLLHPTTNQAPVFSTEFGDRTDAEGALINFDANATDPDGTTVTYSATGLPGGVTIDANTGVVSGTLNSTSSGTYNTVITASDGTLTDTDSFTWTVTNLNQAPVFSTEFGDRTDAEGALINFDADATDPDGTTVTYSASGLPAGVTINSSTGVVSGTIDFAAAGTYNTVITASDGALTDTDTFTWNVTNTNRAPVFSTEFGNRTDAEGALINFDANATDPDAGTTLVYSATGLPSGITINSGTGVVSGTLSATSSGTYNTVLTVSDGTLTDTDSFIWTVTEPNPLIIYVDDTFTRTSVNSWGSATPTGGAYTLSGTAANFAVNGGVGSIIMPSAGVVRSALLNTPSAADVDVSFRVRADKVAVGGAQFIYGVVRRNGTNEYRVKLRLAVNGNVYVQASTVISNVETNIGAEVQVPGLTHTANAFIRFRAQVTGANPTTLRIRAWADAAVEPTTWNYTQTNSNASLQAAGLLGLRTYVASGITNAPVTFGFDDYRVTSIGGPNQAPVFSTEFGDRTDAEGALINFDANATDPDAGTTLVYSATGLPSGVTINSSTGVVSGTLSAVSSGTYNTVITVSDGLLTDTDSLTWTVTNTNQAPVFSTEFGNRTDAEGAVINFDANATDPDAGTTLVYSATGLPGGVTINSSTGVVSGTLNSTSSGTYNTVITVSDGLLTDTDSLTWTVTEPAANQPPVFSTEFGNRTDAEGALINFDANATDPDAGTTLVYSATGLPNGITINSSTGVVSGTLSAVSSGTYNTVLTVSDGTLTDTDSFTWTVTEPLIIYVDDTFTRTSVSSWGSATPTGGAYTLSGTAANFAVNGGVGSIIMPSAGVVRSALLNTPSAADVDVSFRVRADKVAVGGAQFIYGVVRRNGTNEYRVKLRLAVNGNVYVQASTVISNVETNIGAEVQVPGLTHTANAFIRFRAQVTGANPTTLRIRAWADAAVEPTTWNYTQTNSNASLQAAGLLGLRTYVSSGTSNVPVNFGFDDYRVTSLGGP